jgi:predicted nucleotidyltransferase
VHQELNPKIWNSDDTIKEDVYEKLLAIANEFIKYIEIPLNIVDIEIVGSNASYNYNENSDIDLHIIVNSEVNYVEPEILRQLYNSKKNSFNDNYDLSLNDIPIELYIEDVKDGNATNGRYSISKNEWVTFPKPITYDIPDISKELNDYETKCNETLTSTNPQAILDLVNEIYMMRKIGLAEEGEASVGNLVFKELRNEDMITKLKDRYYELRSEELSEN